MADSPIIQREGNDLCGGSDERGRKRKSNSPDFVQRPGSVVCRADCHQHAVRLFAASISLGQYCRSGRLFSGPLLTYLNTQGVSLDALRPMWVCGACIQLGKKVTEGKTVEDLLTANEDDMTETVIRLLVDGKMQPKNLQRIVAAVGYVCGQELKAMSVKQHAILSSLPTVTYEELWNANGLNVTRNLLETAINFSEVSTQRRPHCIRHLQKAAENLCIITRSRYVSPASVGESLLLYAMSGSRFATDLYSSSNASGGHSYMTKLVESISLSKPKFPRGDIYVAFDNQQIIGREYRVSSGGAQRTSVATTICVYQDSFDCNVQQNFPLETIFPVPCPHPNEIWERFIEQRDEWDVIHREYRAQWILQRLRSVKNEWTFKEGDLLDENVLKIIKSEDYAEFSQYYRVPACESSCTVTDMESLPFNPNSYANIRKVLDELIRMNDESDPARKWFVVCCDGLPYNLAWNIVNDTYTCTGCSYDGTKSDIELHKCENVQPKRKYDKIVLRPGAGHIEINIVRSIFKEYFEVFIKPVAKILGYKTPRSLEYCKAAVDHHKSWQILKIVYICLTDEIIHIYAKDTEQPTFDMASFQEWRANLTNSNIILAFDFVFSTLHPLFLYRDAVRRCNDSVASAAFYKCSSLFFGFNHPRYRELVARDLFFQLNLPKLGSPIAERYGYKMAKSNYGQGLDFLLEERNREQKRWVFASGPPTDSQWKRASASLTFFETVKDNIMKNLGLGSTYPRSQQNFADEFIAVRLHFRAILQSVRSTLQSFSQSSVSLNEKFINCSSLCFENMTTYLKAFLTGKKCQLSIVVSTDLLQQPYAEVVKIAAKKIKQIPSLLRGDLQERLMKADVIEKVVDIVGEADEIIQSIGSSNPSDW